MDVSEERTTSKFRVSSPWRQYQNTDCVPFQKNCNFSVKLAADRECKIVTSKPWPRVEGAVEMFGVFATVRNIKLPQGVCMTYIWRAPGARKSNAKMEWKIMFVFIGVQGRYKSGACRLKRTPYVETTCVHLSVTSHHRLNRWSDFREIRYSDSLQIAEEEAWFSWKPVKLFSHLT
jgi:hypothetical protein